MAGHRNVFDRNDIMDNGNEEEGYRVRVLGETNELKFMNNRIGNDATKNQRYGFYVGEKAQELALSNNELSGHSESDVHYEKMP
jgi:hypothetical protein